MTRTALALVLVAAIGQAQDKPKEIPAMDYGPFLSAAYLLKPGAKFDNGTGAFDVPTVSRGIGLKLAHGWEAGAVFDADTCRLAAAWSGAPLKFTGVIFDGAHGPSPTLGVAPAFLTPYGPGWAKGGSFRDPRPDSIKPLPAPGPLPAECALVAVWLTLRGGTGETSPGPFLEGGAGALPRDFAL